MTAPAASTRHDAPASGGSTVGDRPKLRIQWSDLGIFVLLYAGLTVAWFGLGKLVLAIDSLTDLDQRIAERFVETRTPSLDDWAVIGAGLADTAVKIVVTAIVAIAMYVIWRRKDEWMTVVLPLILEASAFITVTYLIKRPRPDVPRLQDSPVNSSFPSGHVAAAAAYSAIVIVVFQHTRNVVARTVAVLIGVLIVITVAWARLYQGMHFFTDVIAGAALGLASVVACWWLLRRMRMRADQA